MATTANPISDNTNPTSDTRLGQFRPLLASLRWRIRLYIWLEGLALAAIWLGVTFWLALAADYLPVIAGASEMPLAARAIVAAVVAAVTLYILWYYIARRAFVPLRDESMAILLERQYAGFQDALVTSVELAGKQGGPQAGKDIPPAEMVERTVKQAAASVGEVRLAKVFNLTPLLLKLLLGTLAIGSIGLLGIISRPTLATAADRLILLGSTDWPRSAILEIVGVELERKAEPGQPPLRPILLPFENGIVKVARGSSVSLKVRALQTPAAKIVPASCTVYYQSVTTGQARGERGNVVMSNFRDTDDHRNFWFDGKPFRSVLSTIVFDVVGYDARLRDLRLEVVDSPAVIETTLDLTYPPYLVDEATSNFLPTKGKAYLPSGTFVPAGTEVTLQMRSSKNLREATITRSDTGERTVIDMTKQKSRERFSFQVPALRESVSLDVLLIDEDNVPSDKPYRVFLTAIEDQAPVVDVRLKGIGTSVTPDVRIPMQGKVTDDYAIERAWIVAQVNDSGDPQQIPATLATGGALDVATDFREQRTAKTPLEIKPGDKLFLAVEAVDRFNLSDAPHTGSGDRWELEVVTPDQLLASLEVRELGMRRRLEQILDEMMQLRDSLLRVKSSLAPSSSVGNLEELRSDDDPEAKPLTAAEIARRQAEVRLLRVQRALQQSQKSVQEVQGVAAGFLDIREELINNRVDTEDRKNRLKDLIADPLNKCAEVMFPELDRRIILLEEKLRDTAQPAGDDVPGATDTAIDQSSATIAELEAVLEKMLDLETYNELLDIVRSLIKDQEELSEKTKQERKRQALEDLK